MISLGIVYTLISVLLFVVATIIHVKAASLSLPLPPALNILTILLPLASLLAAALHPAALRASRRPRARLAPSARQARPALLATAVAALLLERAAPASEVARCALEREWMRRFRAHDGPAIRAVQDALACCGFNSVRDRAFPFPGQAPSSCPETYGRSVACAGPWGDAMRSYAGGDLAVVLAVGLLQIVNLLVTREDTNWWAAWWPRGWKHPVVRRGSRRQLLTAEAGDEESARHDDHGQHGYTDANDDGPGPRVEPSPIREHNAWDE